jgi:rare lipoprotein A
MRRLFTVIISVFFLLTFSVNLFAEKLPVITGKASWYSARDKTDPFPHIRNADGSRFDENAYTCALRSRSFGRRYKVTNLRNGRSIIVKHADYGPALKYNGRQLNRVIDLSKAAFAAIADLGEGVIMVKVEEV